MTNIHAAIWNVQLTKLEWFNSQRNTNAKLYNSLLSNQNILQLPNIILDRYHVFHQYTVLVKESSHISREEIQNKLSEKWIPTAIHYPIPIHLQPYYKNLGYKTDICPNTQYLCKNIFSLPIYPWITWEEIEYISHTLLGIITN